MESRAKKAKGGNAGVKAVNTEDQTQAQNQTQTQTTNEPLVSIPQSVVLDMQRRIEEIAANTNDVTNNMRVHIFNDKTDG